MFAGHIDGFMSFSDNARAKTSRCLFYNRADDDLPNGMRRKINALLRLSYGYVVADAD